MTFGVRTFVASLTITVLAFAASAQAAPISKCNAAKKTCIGKYVAAALKCHARAEHDGVAVDAGCLSKAAAKVTGGGKGCFDRVEAKMPNDCSTAGDAAQQLGAADALISDVVNAVDPSYPAPTLTLCGAARKKCAAKKAAGLMKCAARANKTGADDLACLAKVRDHFGGGSGCDVKALAKGPDCLGSASSADLETMIDVWQLTVADDLDATTHCGNGSVEPNETCDASAPPGPGQLCAGGAACLPDCTCECCPCPTSVHLVPDATSDETRRDEGWTGMTHRMPIASGADLTLAISGCIGSPSCGACSVSGPLANVRASELRNRRCSNDTSIRCTDDTPCLAGGGTCETYAGPPLPLAGGGIGACTVSRWVGSITGTVDVEAGAIAYTAALRTDVFGGPQDNPCIKCAGDPVVNDDVQAGTCAGGPRNGLACDANGSVPGRPDFGATSLDCPSTAANLYRSIVTDASAASATVTKVLSASSPICGSDPRVRCLCDTCNHAAATPCYSNADCVAVGATICGGRRCVGGTNNGGVCISNTACPGGGACGRAGEPTKPSACLDDSAPVPNCVDTDPVEGEGECIFGPLGKTCSVASGHAQRPCSIDADCGGPAGACEAHNRPCFLTGDPSFDVGTGTLVAEGAPSAPVANVASPTLGSVYCSPQVNAAVVDVTRGLPGPVRVTAKTTMTFRP